MPKLPAIAEHRRGNYKALSGEGNPSFATILKVTNALGLQLHAASRRAPV